MTQNDIKTHSKARRCLLAGAMLSSLPVSASGVLLEEFLTAADRGRCIEDVTHQMIRSQGKAGAERVVKTALQALARRERQQRALGCDGDIAVQAIAAGADPETVLQATAAGL